MRILIIALMGLGLFVENAWGSVQYTIINLGHGAANAINSSGQAVGYTYTTSGVDHAGLYSNGTVTDLGTFGGPYSLATGINDSGQIVGYADLPSGANHAFLYSNGTMKDLGTLGGTNSMAYGINNSGQIVGVSQIASGKYRPFLYSNGIMTNLGTLGGTGNGQATAINGSGQIVGFSYTANTPESASAQHAFLYSNGTMKDLGTLPGSSVSSATDINASGQVVGDSSDYPFYHSFLYSGGTMSVLWGGESYSARAISDSGQVLASKAQDAYLYSNGTMSKLQDLIDPALGWINLIHADAINDSGWIVGIGNNQSGGGGAFLMMPIPDLSILLWTGGASGNDNWTTSTNWGGTSPVAGKQLQFGALVSGHASNYNDIDGSPQFNGITFTGGNLAYELKGKPIKMAGPVINQSGSNQSISLDIDLVSGGGTFDTGVKSIFVTGEISGTATLLKKGVGTLTLAVTPTYTGDITVDAGLLQINANATMKIISGAGDLGVGNDAQLTATSITVDTLTIGGTGATQSVPEPGSLLMTAIIAVMGLFYCWRRNR